MPTTTNFGWTTPADTDLVKDGALAIRTLGNGIDTSMVDLKGGTTGQNLRKNSNTDMDFVWAGDATNTVIDAEGDLLVGDSADTLQRLAIGTTGQVLTVDTTIDGKIKWATAATGGYTQLDSGSLSGSVTTISSISGSYKDLILVLQNFQTTANTGFGLRLNNDSTTANYKGTWIRDAGGSGSVGTIGSNSFIQGNLGNDMTTGNNKNQQVWFINDYANATAYKTVTASTYFYASGPSHYAGWISAAYLSTTAIDRLDFVNNASTWSSGTYVLYGVK